MRAARRRETHPSGYDGFLPNIAIPYKPQTASNGTVMKQIGARLLSAPLNDTSVN
jgi:hypothetical protein